LHGRTATTRADGFITGVGYFPYYEMLVLITVLEKKGILFRNEIIEVIKELKDRIASHDFDNFAGGAGCNHTTLDYMALRTG
jgi:hypothetical protein